MKEVLMSARVISADRVARLLTACDELLVTITTQLESLQRLAETGAPNVFKNVAGEPAFEVLIVNVRLFVACGGVAPEPMARKLDDLAGRFPAPSLRALLATAAHELRGE